MARRKTRTEVQVKRMIHGCYENGEMNCYISNELGIANFGGVCDHAGSLDPREGCPDTNRMGRRGKCPFNQSGPDATFRFEVCRLLSEILKHLKKTKKR